jgi:hypothetical protein
MRNSTDIFDYKSTEVFHTRIRSVSITQGNYKGINITERYTSPSFWGRKASTVYMIDLVLPLGTYDCLSDSYYTADGYGVPELEDLDKVIEFIDQYLEKNK